MLTLMKLELKKIINRPAFFVGILASIIVLFGIFFTSFYYSQLSLSERNNVSKGSEQVYWKVVKKYTGDFNDETVKNVLSDFVSEYQKYPVEKRPFNLFASNIADDFFPTDTDVYTTMNKAMENGETVTIDQINLKSVADLGFPTFKTPLKLGSYVTWSDLFKVNGYIFVLGLCITIVLSSSIFSGEVARNIHQLLVSAKFGRTKMVQAKIVGTTLLSALCFILLEIITFLVFIIYNKGFSGWDTSIQTNFSLKLFTFPAEMNQLQVYIVMLLFYLLALLATASITLLVSSLTSAPITSLIISTAITLAPLGLIKVFRSGIINKLLYLIPINNFTTGDFLTFFSGQSGLLTNSFYLNIAIIFTILILVQLSSNTLILYRFKK